MKSNNEIADRKTRVTHPRTRSQLGVEESVWHIPTGAPLIPDNAFNIALPNQPNVNYSLISQQAEEQYRKIMGHPSPQSRKVYLQAPIGPQYIGGDSSNMYRDTPAEEITMSFDVNHTEYATITPSENEEFEPSLPEAEPITRRDHASPASSLDIDEIIARGNRRIADLHATLDRAIEKSDRVLATSRNVPPVDNVIAPPGEFSDVDSPSSSVHTTSRRYLADTTSEYDPLATFNRLAAERQSLPSGSSFQPGRFRVIRHSDVLDHRTRSNSDSDQTENTRNLTTASGSRTSLSTIDYDPDVYVRQIYDDRGLMDKWRDDQLPFIQHMDRPWEFSHHGFWAKIRRTTTKFLRVNEKVFSFYSEPDVFKWTMDDWLKFLKPFAWAPTIHVFTCPKASPGVKYSMAIDFLSRWVNPVHCISQAIRFSVTFVIDTVIPSLVSFWNYLMGRETVELQAGGIKPIITGALIIATLVIAGTSGAATILTEGKLKQFFKLFNFKDITSAAEFCTRKADKVGASLCEMLGIEYRTDEQIAIDKLVIDTELMYTYLQDLNEFSSSYTSFIIKHSVQLKTLLSKHMMLVNKIFKDQISVKQRHSSVCTNLNSKMQAMLRQAIGKMLPVTIVLTGEPGKGKDVFMAKLRKEISNHLHLRNDLYTIPASSDKFWTGYLGQTHVVLDDMFFFTDGAACAAETGVVKSIYSTMTFVPNQAAIEDKKTSFFTSPFFYITSNHNSPPGNVVFAENNTAIQRRCDIRLYLLADRTQRLENADFDETGLLRDEALHKIVVGGQFNLGRPLEGRNDVLTFDQVKSKCIELYQARMANLRLRHEQAIAAEQYQVDYDIDRLYKHMKFGLQAYGMLNEDLLTEEQFNQAREDLIACQTSGGIINPRVHDRVIPDAQPPAPQPGFTVTPGRTNVARALMANAALNNACAALAHGKDPNLPCRCNEGVANCPRHDPTDAPLVLEAPLPDAKQVHVSTTREDLDQFMEQQVITSKKASSTGRIKFVYGKTGLGKTETIKQTLEREPHPFIIVHTHKQYAQMIEPDYDWSQHVGQVVYFNDVALSYKGASIWCEPFVQLVFYKFANGDNTSLPLNVIFDGNFEKRHFKQLESYLKSVDIDVTSFWRRMIKIKMRKRYNHVVGYFERARGKSIFRVTRVHRYKEVETKPADNLADILEPLFRLEDVYTPPVIDNLVIQPEIADYVIDIKVTFRSLVEHCTTREHFIDHLFKNMSPRWCKDFYTRPLGELYHEFSRIKSRNDSLEEFAKAYNSRRERDRLQGRVVYIRLADTVLILQCIQGYNHISYCNYNTMGEMANQVKTQTLQIPLKMRILQGLSYVKAHYKKILIVGGAFAAIVGLLVGASAIYKAFTSKPEELCNHDETVQLSTEARSGGKFSVSDDDYIKIRKQCEKKGQKCTEDVIDEFVLCDEEDDYHYSGSNYIQGYYHNANPGPIKVSLPKTKKTVSFEKGSDKVKPKQGAITEGCLAKPELKPVIATVCKNIVVIFSSLNQRICYGLVLREGVVLSISHSFKHGASYYCRFVYDQSKPDDYPLTMTHMNKKRDFTLFVLPRNIICRDITTHMIVKSDELSQDAYTYAAIPDATVGTILVPSKFSKVFTYRPDNQPNQTYEGAQMTVLSYGAAYTMQGDCGSPVFILLNNRLRLLGIHAAAGSSTRIATYLLKEELIAAHPIKNEGFDCEQNFSRVLPITKYEEPIPVNDHTDTVIVGTMPANMGSDKTTISKTETYGIHLFADKPEMCNLQPALLSEKDPRFDPEVCPNGLVFKCVEKFTSAPPEHDESVARLTYVNMSAKYHEVLNESDNQNLSPISLTECVNGIVGEPLSPKIEMTSSTGLPYIKMGYHKKSEFFELDEEKKIYVLKDPKKTPAVKLLLDEMGHVTNRARRGEIVHSVYNVILKDELRKEEHIKAHKSRAIQACPLHITLLFRRYFARFCVVLMKNRDKIAPQVGINPMSSDWNFMALRLLTKGSKVFDADVKNQDASMYPFIIKSVNKMILDIIYRFDPDDGNHAVRKALLGMFENPKMLVNNEVWSMQGRVMSGNPITAIYNSLLMEYTIAYCYHKCAILQQPFHRSYLGYRSAYEVVTFGDDNVVSLSDKVYKWWNLKTLIAEAAKINVTITDAHKSSDPPPYTDISKITFLKRSFRKEGNNFYGPLDPASITKAFWHHRTKKKQTFEEFKNSKYVFTEDDRQTLAREILDQVVFHGEVKFNYAKKVLSKYKADTFRSGVYFNVPSLSYTEHLADVLNMVETPTSMAVGDLLEKPSGNFL